MSKLSWQWSWKYSSFKVTLLRREVKHLPVLRCAVWLCVPEVYHCGECYTIPRPSQAKDRPLIKTDAWLANATLGNGCLHLNYSPLRISYQNNKSGWDLCWIISSQKFVKFVALSGGFERLWSKMRRREACGPEGTLLSWGTAAPWQLSCDLGDSRSSSWHCWPSARPLPSPRDVSHTCAAVTFCRRRPPSTLLPCPVPAPCQASTYWLSWPGSGSSGLAQRTRFSTFLWSLRRSELFYISWEKYLFNIKTI